MISNLMAVLSLDPQHPECLPIPAQEYNQFGDVVKPSELYAAALIGILRGRGISEERPIVPFFCPEGNDQWDKFSDWLGAQDRQYVNVSFAGIQGHSSEYLVVQVVYFHQHPLISISIADPLASAIDDFFCSKDALLALLKEFGAPEAGLVHDINEEASRG